MAELSLQEQLFRQVRVRLGPGNSLPEVIAEVLHVSYDSAYRRIRGETLLVLEEARILCERFQLSLDQILSGQRGEVLFTYVQVNKNGYSFEHYLKDILDRLETLALCRQKAIIYRCKDLPFFYNFSCRPLFAFHYFFWMKTIIQDPRFAGLQFSMDLLTEDMEHTGKKIIQAYNNIPSTEIWNTECINSIIAQIEYYREAGYFARDADIEEVYGALVNVISHIQLQAEKGIKFLPGERSEFRKENFSLYYNRIVLGDNTIYATTDNQGTVYLSHDVLDYMITKDEAFCPDIEQKLQSQIKRSTIISKVSEKQRNIFFNILLRKIPQKTTTNAALT